MKTETAGCFTRRSLPDPLFAALAQRCIYPNGVERLCRNLIKLGYSFGDSDTPVEICGVRNFNLLAGPPGNGKTSLANVLASHFAMLNERRRGQTTVLYELYGARMFQDVLGQSVKAVNDTFDQIGFSARRGPVVVWIDELDSLAQGRENSRSGDPTEVGRVVTTLLLRLDELFTCRSALVMGATNLASTLDRALVSRADLVLPIGRPTRETASAILRETAAETSDVLQVSDAAIAEFVQTWYGEDKSPLLGGRELRKLIAVAAAMSGHHNVSARALLAAARFLTQETNNAV